MSTKQEHAVTHTPTPWRITECDVPYIASEREGYVPLCTPFREAAFLGKHGEGLVGTDAISAEEIRANMALIVRAVNAHAELVAALEAADYAYTVGGAFRDPHAERTREQIRAALAKARHP